MSQDGVKAVVIGGGTGTFTVLSALKHYIGDITAIVNMVDDGGSTGVLRDELGVLPPGDARQCLVALSPESAVMRELFNYRFGGKSSLQGHSFGNLFLTALEKVTGSFGEAVKTAGEVLAIQGRVVPVTNDNVRLHLRLPDGRVIEGEDTIGERVAGTDWFRRGQKPDLFLSPSAKLNPDAARAIKQADLIIICPGKLYSSVGPNLLVEGMSEALQKSRGRKIYICNLMTQPGQTDFYRVADFVDGLEALAGGPVVDYVVYNTTVPSDDLLERYAMEGEQMVDFDESDFADKHYQAVGRDLISRTIYKQDPNDTKLKRTLIRHDSDKLARLLMRIYFS